MGDVKEFPPSLLEIARDRRARYAVKQIQADVLPRIRARQRQRRWKERLFFLAPMVVCFLGVVALFYEACR